MESGRQPKTQNACLENIVYIRAPISFSPLLKVLIEYLVCEKKSVYENMYFYARTDHKIDAHDSH